MAAEWGLKLGREAAEKILSEERLSLEADRKLFTLTAEAAVARMKAEYEAKMERAMRVAEMFPPKPPSRKSGLVSTVLRATPLLVIFLLAAIVRASQH